MQGKYLQSVLEKAQQFLASQATMSTGNDEVAKPELADLASDVTTECIASPLPALPMPTLPGIVTANEFLKKNDEGKAATRNLQVSEDLSAAFSFDSMNLAHYDRGMNAQFCKSDGFHNEGLHDNLSRAETAHGGTGMVSMDGLSWERCSVNVVYQSTPMEHEQDGRTRWSDKNSSVCFSDGTLGHRVVFDDSISRLPKANFNSLQQARFTEQDALLQRLEAFSPSRIGTCRNSVDNVPPVSSGPVTSRGSEELNKIGYEWASSV